MKKVLCTLLLFILCGVQTNCLAIVDTNNIEVTTTPVALSSKLRKNYVGYEYNITNNTPKKVNIVNAQIVNGQDGNIAYNSNERGAGSAVGITWAIAGPVGLFTLGIGWLAGIVATPIVWIVANNNDKKARTESIPYTNMVPLGYINTGDSVIVKSLVPVGSKPQLKLTVMDEKTKELESIVK